MTNYLGQDIISTARRELLEVRLFEQITAAGLKSATSSVARIEWLKRNKEFLEEGEAASFSPTNFDQMKKEAQAHEEWARQEATQGFPYLYGLLSIRLWSILEAYVDAIASIFLGSPLESANRDMLSRIKVPFAAFIIASPEERAELAFVEYKRLIAAGLKLGVGRFEELLGPLGLGGPIDGDVRRALMELSEIRHVLVHRGGKADQRLLRNCPWLGSQLSAAVQLSHPECLRFVIAVYWYVEEVDARCRRATKAPINEQLERWKQEGLAHLRTLSDDENAKT